MYDACEEKDFIHASNVHNLLEVMKNVIIVVNQYKIVLNSCPNEDDFESSNVEIPVLLPVFSDAVQNKHDRSWTDAMGLIKKILSSAYKLRNHIFKCKGSVPSVEYELIIPHYIVVPNKSALVNDIQDIRCDLEELKRKLGGITITQSITWLQNEIDKILNSEEPPFEQLGIDDYKQLFSSFCEQILLVIQNVFKRYSAKETSDVEKDEDVEGDQLKEGHLKTHLIDNLSSDLSILEMRKVLLSTQRIAETLLKCPPKLSGITSVSLQCLPLLEQIIQMYQYFITQQVAAYRITCKMTSILLNIFIELTSKVSSVQKTLGFFLKFSYF